MPSRSMNRRGRLDAISLLTQDHSKVKRLLAARDTTTERAVNRREALLKEIETEIKIHSKVEEEIFYPAYKEAVRKGDDHLYYEALEEHSLVDTVLHAMKSSDAASEEFGAKAKVLKDLIEHHAGEEETEMFPKARKAMGAARLKELGQEMQERKHELSTGLFGRTIERMRGTRRRVA